MQFTALVSLAAIAMALPQKRSLSGAEFGLKMRLGAGESAPLVTLSGVQNGTEAFLLLVADDGPETPAYLNGTSPDGALNLDVSGVSYGVSAADTGDIHGIATTIEATKGYQDFAWSVGQGYVNHKLTSAAQQFLACNWTVNGEIKPVLAWGSYYDNGSYPYGCYATTLYSNCDVAGSTATC